ncbi:hypothetical protein D3C72_1215880 [compost metagenome]
MATDPLTGVTCSAVTVADVTVSSAVALNSVPFALPLAVMVTSPALTPVARPLLLPALPIVTIVGSLLTQLSVGLSVTSWVVLSDKMAMAVNCWVNPLATDPLAGVTCSAVTVADVTVSSAVALNDMLLALPLAVIITSPALIPVTMPLLPFALLIVAVLILLLNQVTAASLVTSRVL